jgi:uncharacterized protein YjbI with pentapeptide repeats
VTLDEAGLARLIERAAAGEPVAATDLVLSAESVDRLKKAAPRCDGRAFLVNADFQDATFVGHVTFDKVAFEGGASFDRARFEGGSASFWDSTFHGTAAFNATVFSDNVWFTHATVEQRAEFDEAKFLGAQASFQHTTFGGDASFDYAVFESTIVGFEESYVDGDLSFLQATFAHGGSWGELRARGTVDFADAKFEERPVLRAHAPHVTFRRAQFRRGLSLFMRDGDVAFDEAEFGAPSIVTSRSEEATARVVSLVRANVENLVLANVDLRACRFGGAHNLDRLRLEDVVFSRTPRWWAQRQTLAEEEEWRHSRNSKDGWYGEKVRSPGRPLTPGAIAPLYRALRKGLEDTRDEPGAADFYYGEMEMRRHAPVGRAIPTNRPKSLAEHMVLTLYWLVAGYGLRGGRALAALAVTIVVFSLLLWQFGFDPQQPYLRALLFSAESTSSLFRTPELPKATLTYGGEALQIVLRLLGPLFLGLAILSLRGRVKR